MGAIGVPECPHCGSLLSRDHESHQCNDPLERPAWLDEPASADPAILAKIEQSRRECHANLIWRMARDCTMQLYQNLKLTDGYEGTAREVAQQIVPRIRAAVGEFQQQCDKIIQEVR